MRIASSPRRLSRVSFTFPILVLILLFIAGGCSKRDKLGAASDDDGGGGGPGIVGDAGLPAVVGDPFCPADDITGVPTTGYRTIDIEAADIVAWCSGWVFIADKTNERVVLQNIFTGETDFVYDLPGAPGDLELDETNSRIYATLPTEQLIASIDLVGTEHSIVFVNSEPLSIALSDDEVLVAAGGGSELRVYAKVTLEHIINSSEFTGDFIRFNPDGQQIVSANASAVFLFNYDLNVVDPDNPILMLVPDAEDPTGSTGIGLELSPNYDRLAVVAQDGNESAGGPFVINDFNADTAEDTFGGWKVESEITGAAFSPLNGGDSDYLLASSASDLIIFDTVRHAKVSSRTPSSGCGGDFSDVEFSRGGEIAIGKMACGSTPRIELHWWAASAGFGNSTSLIGVNETALSTVLSTDEAVPLCTTDDLNAVTSSSGGSLSIPRAGSVVPLCDGWVFVSERETNRIVMRNVVTGVTLAEWDLPDMPREMLIVDGPGNKFLFASMPMGFGIARIDLAGPGLGDVMSETVAGFPTTLTRGNDDYIWTNFHFDDPGALGVRAIHAPTFTISTPSILELAYLGSANTIAFDQATDQMFVSDATGTAQFTQGGGPATGADFDLTNPGDEEFAELNSGIVVASPDGDTIALVDQTTKLVYDIDDGELADFHRTWWDIDTDEPITGLSFDALGETLGVATTTELIIFDATDEHGSAETDGFDPSGCGGDFEAFPAISRGADIGFYKSDCGDGGLSETIFWYEL